MADHAILYGAKFVQVPTLELACYGPMGQLVCLAVAYECGLTVGVGGALVMPSPPVLM